MQYNSNINTCILLNSVDYYGVFNYYVTVTVTGLKLNVVTREQTDLQLAPYSITPIK